MKIEQPKQPSPRTHSAQSLGAAPGHHICLAGISLSSNWNLVGALKKRHQVTVVESIDRLADNGLLTSVEIVALDCGGQPESGASLIRKLRATYPLLRFVLVNGGLSQAEIANAFREGADDYFSGECGAALLIERIEHICKRLRDSQPTRTQ